MVSRPNSMALKLVKMFEELKGGASFIQTVSSYKLSPHSLLDDVVDNR